MNLERPMRIVYARLVISAIVIGALLAIARTAPVKPMTGAPAHAARMAHR
jgi:hypothetical protein